MAIYKNNNGTWYVMIRYQDWTGARKQKCKRGFATRKEAADWELQFKLQKKASLDMTMESFCALYEEDVRPSLKQSTWLTKENIIQKKILPYLGQRKVSEITAKDVMDWHNQMRKLKTKTGKPLSPTYLKTIHGQLSTIFNHAVKYYDLSINPARKAGALGEEEGKGGNYMELSIQIKKYRTELHLSQEELAEKVYVTRQTISNWENEKSYPDIHSLLLLSSLFNVSLDQLIKGDIEKMKEIISEQEIKKFNYYGSIYTVHLAVLIISAVPLFMWLGRYAYIPFGILFIITQYWALKVEKLKKKNDIQTYKEIVAFTEGKKLDELHKAVEVGKRPYQNILKVIISAGVTAMICFLIGVLMHLFLN